MLMHKEGSTSMYFLWHNIILKKTRIGKVERIDSSNLLDICYLLRILPFFRYTQNPTASSYPVVYKNQTKCSTPPILC